jgi:alkaline phosphatase D
MYARRSLLKTLPLTTLTLQAADGEADWLGADYYANPMQDWKLSNGRMECRVAGGDRNVYLLTSELREQKGDFQMKVRLGALDVEAVRNSPGWVGFRLGIKSYFRHYKDAAVRGIGLNVGISQGGMLFIGQPEKGPVLDDWKDLTLTVRLRGEWLELEAGEKKMSQLMPEVWLPWLSGGVALVCNSGSLPVPPAPVTEPLLATAPKPGTARGGNWRWWFRDWSLSGAKVTKRPERAWGPILFNQFTVSRGVMKMTVQMAPGQSDVTLHLGAKPVLPAVWHADSATAHFRVEKWNEAEAVAYVLRCGQQEYKGNIPANPKNKEKVVVASLTCQNDFGYPHAEIARNVEKLQPDLLLFTGDQLYERNGEYGIQRKPFTAARLDYLRKWNLFGWAWGHLTRNIPCVCLPDDHDVYHGNLWGASGRRAEYPNGNEQDQQGGQDSGGYTMPLNWVSMVERSQTSHLPDPADPTPLDGGMRSYFTQLEWGGISFALMEDRKFKSAPSTLLPEAKIRNGWSKNPAWDARKSGDAEGAQLLGLPQEAWLARWAEDWKDDTWMKCAVSATIFCNLATLPLDSTDDSVTPGMPVYPVGAWAPRDKLVQDHDSNGWPQTPRKRAVGLLRSCLAVHLAGDQHLGSTVQYGVDADSDASWALCAPAISNLWPRRWFPPGEPRRMFGAFQDGFGNRINVKAVANPHQYGHRPFALHDRACGFSVVEFHRATHRIRLVNWPRWADVAVASEKPYPGWPLEIDQMENGLSATAWELRGNTPFAGLVSVRTLSGQHVWTCRLAKPRATLPVWQPGEYVVKHAGGELRLTAAKLEKSL